MRRMNFEKWWDKFVPTGTPKARCAPYIGDTPRMFETYGEDYETVVAKHKEAPDCIWTLVDDGSAYGSIIPGLHFVNRMGYFITEHPALPGQRDVKV